jgi:hypothetical protein
MNRLILIGNGFDLAHGLKTSYHDFILDYFKNCFIAAILNSETIIHNDIKYKCRHEDKLISLSIQNMPHFFDIELSSKEVIIKKFNDATSISEVQALANKYNSNITYKGNGFVDTLLNECITKNWVDIESLYYDELKKCLKQYNKDKDYNGKASIESLIHLNVQLDFIKNKLIEYLKGISTQNKISGLEFEIYEDIFYKEKNPIDNKVLFLNFNYTDTSEKYLRKNTDFTADSIINIHGKLTNPNNPIIFGYGDEVDRFYNEIENLNENEFFKHIKSFDYFKTSNYSNLLRFIEVNEFEIFVMGHSCGLSDRTLLNTLFEHENCTSIKIFYNPNDIKDYKNKTFEISRHFNNKASMRKKIVSFSNAKEMPQFK